LVHPKLKSHALREDRLQVGRDLAVVLVKTVR
jgi:hypothetical protein